MLERAQEKSLLSYKPSTILWTSSRVFSPDELLQYHRLRGVANICEIPFRESDCGHLTNANLKKLIAEMIEAGIEPGTTILAVAGSFLEDQISRCCLHAIAEGYDTHLICDAVFALEKSLIQTHTLRLTQFGVVPSSLNQMISFLIADETDENVISSLKQHLKLVD